MVGMSFCSFFGAACATAFLFGVARSLSLATSGAASRGKGVLGCARAVRVVPRGARPPWGVAGCLSGLGRETHHCQHKHGCEHDAHRHEHLDLRGEARGHLDGLHGVHSATNAARSCGTSRPRGQPEPGKKVNINKLRAVGTCQEGSWIALDRLGAPPSPWVTDERGWDRFQGLLVSYRPLANYRPPRLPNGASSSPVLVSPVLGERKLACRCRSNPEKRNLQR